MSAEAPAAVAERERNRLLRRADWRYLLPDPAPRRALCLAGSALREACALVAGAVDDAPQPDVRYDLVVAEDPDDATRRSIAGALAATGVCYTEWSARTPGAAARARRATEEAGLRDARSYRPWPSVERCRAWVPTEGAAARWWWNSAARATDVRRQQLHAAIGALQSRFGAHGRVAVIARGAEAPAAPRLVALARQHGALSAGSDSASLVLLTPGARSVGKVILLPFAAATPVAAIKTARTADAAHGLEREADLLDVVHGQHGGALVGAPRVLFRARALDTTVVGESALTGAPLLARLDARRYASIAERVTEWLVRLAEPATGAPRQPVWERVAGPAFDRFTSEFGALVDDAALARTKTVLATLGELPVVVEQRDFSPWNVFESDAGLVVLDWESGVAAGVPALDLIYFVTYAAYYLEGAWVSGKYEAAYRAAWSRDTAIGRVNLACVERYLGSLGLPFDLLSALRLLAWLLHSHSDWVHRRDDAGTAPGTDALRDSQFLRLFRAELGTIDR
ncbi:MAG: hypothetical protein ACJ79A_02790 [Gemmatimonadaceae bacterium]